LNYHCQDARVFSTFVDNITDIGIVGARILLSGQPVQGVMVYGYCLAHGIVLRNKAALLS
jgi:hypothetical protein